MAAAINGVLLCAALAAALGCSIVGASGVRAKASQVTALCAPLSAGSTLSANTHNGTITVNGIDSSDCSVSATVRAYALTEARARELAAATKVALVSSGNGLTVAIDQPRTRMNESISVDLDISAPKAARLDMSGYNGDITITAMRAGARVRSHNGKVTMTGIAGDVDTESYNGRTECTGVSGNVKAESHNGAITLDAVTGDVRAESYNGKVAIVYAENASSAPNVTVISHNGNVSLTTPKRFSAAAEVATHNGSFKCSAHFLMEKKSGGTMSGTFGDGKGRLELRTYNGNVQIK
jgi:DUF4097 and DUF4098 domain-containing protein YvlB